VDEVVELTLELVEVMVEVDEVDVVELEVMFRVDVVVLSVSLVLFPWLFEGMHPLKSSRKTVR